MKSSNEIRAEFLKFFEEKGHTIVPSTPVVPADDPTLLFINAGMNQFKNIFLGTEKIKHTRITDTQKCIRVSGKHNDLEDVGIDTSHHTFFEMLGNWSFGDYYKKEAIEWAWELLTEVWGLEKERIWATVHDTDAEAKELWPGVTDLPSDRVLEFGDKDNFWEMGEIGPCGPCSEIHYYIGDDISKQSADKINSGDPDYLEIWNLVFIQFNRDSKGKLKELPKKHVDTGLGFERIVSIIQGKKSNYDTDSFSPIIDEIKKVTGKKYEGEDQPAFRVIADHLRSLCFSIADGVMPSNEGRGYVIRRLLRRAARFGRTLGMQKPFIYNLVSTLCEMMGEIFPELIEKQEYIEKVIKSEELNFGETIDRGIELFNSVVSRLEKEKKNVIPGKDIFKLYDTFGFPVDLTELMAKEKGLGVDIEKFNEEMTHQKERSRSGRKFVIEELIPEGVELTSEPTDFLGYDSLEVETEITQIISLNDRDISLLLKETPYYAESGGQIGDSGVIKNDEINIQVNDTQKIGDSFYLHIGIILEGDPKEGMSVIASVDKDKRRNILPNHTSTHLMHAALRKILGTHVRQAGSLVAADRLRFDYTHSEKPSRTLLNEIETLVNRKIRENIKINTINTNFEDAKKAGAMALFGEKYGDDVRMVEIGDFSKELCGGTHVNRTGDIGTFLITQETGISSGVRRIEALTGEEAFEYIQENMTMLSEIEGELSVSVSDLPERIRNLSAANKQLEKKLKEKGVSSYMSQIDSWISEASEIQGVTLVAKLIDSSSLDELKSIGDALRDKLKSGVGVLGATVDKKASLITVMTKDLIDSGLSSKDIVTALGKIIGGGGGGSAHMATAGGNNPKLLKDAIEKSASVLESFLNKKT